MNEKQLHILRHSLGLTRKNESYRNHFVTFPGGKDYEDCMFLVGQGYMRRNKYDTFYVTKLGKDALKKESE